MLILFVLVLGFGLGYEATSDAVPVQKEAQYRQHEKECPIVNKGK